MKVCIIGASGKLGRYMVRHALDRGYEVVGVCREKSVTKLDAFKGRITIIPGARLIFSCGWHITHDGQDEYSRTLRIQEKFAVWIGRLTRLIDINDQIEACRRIFASDTLWTVVRGSDLEEGESQGLPVWSRHVGAPILESNMTRRVDFALFMVEALSNNALVHEAPAIVGCRTPSALAHAADAGC